MMVDSSCKVHRINLAIRPIHDREPWATTTSFARVMTEDNAGFGPSTAPVTVDKAMERAVVVVVFRDSIFFDNEAHTRATTSWRTWWRSGRRLDGTR